jgi:predicted RNase H-like HicB family nuclease
MGCSSLNVRPYLGVSQGATEEEAERNIKEAIKECLEVRAEKGITTSL